jgi:hypothetical protein
MTKITVTIEKEKGGEPIHIRVEGHGDQAHPEEVETARAITSLISDYMEKFPHQTIIPKTESISTYGSN